MLRLSFWGFRNALMVVAVFAMVSACGPSKRIVTRSKTKPKEARLARQPKALTNFRSDSERITIMTWNMENLFDTVDDPNHNDDAYLPLKEKKKIPDHDVNCNKADAYSWKQQCLNWDWNENAFHTKLNHLAQVIRSVNDGRGPDVLVVQEVENLFVLQELIARELPNMGYTAYLLENNDYRGIDVGLITRLPLSEEIKLQELRSRPALRARLKLSDDSVITFYGVHLPISPTPVEKRLDMVKKLKALADENPKEFTIALGDFNFPNEIEERNDIIGTYLKPDWAVAHLYCDTCNGTFHDSYNNDYSQLDYILLTKSFFEPSTTWTLDPASVRIHNLLPFQFALDDSPADFNLPDMKGVSDHWPLVLQLVKTN